MTNENQLQIELSSTNWNDVTKPQNANKSYKLILN